MEEQVPETWADLLPLMDGEIKLVIEHGDITFMTFENNLVGSDLSVAEELVAVAIHLIHLFVARLSTQQLASQPSCSGILEARQAVPQLFIDAFADEEQPD